VQDINHRSFFGSRVVPTDINSNWSGKRWPDYNIARNQRNEGNGSAVLIQSEFCYGRNSIDYLCASAVKLA
jgi:hypothetical protein